MRMVSTQTGPLYACLSTVTMTRTGRHLKRASYCGHCVSTATGNSMICYTSLKWISTQPCQSINLYAPPWHVFLMQHPRSGDYPAFQPIYNYVAYGVRALRSIPQQPYHQEVSPYYFAWELIYDHACRWTSGRDPLLPPLKKVKERVGDGRMISWGYDTWPEKYQIPKFCCWSILSTTLDA